VKSAASVFPFNVQRAHIVAQNGVAHVQRITQMVCYNMANLSTYK
jgi:hypothetical protein